MFKKIAICIFAVCLIPSISMGGDAKLTIYDDGLSCPASCDSHVVFHPSLNGTKHAHKPGGDSDKCTNGSECEICFTHSDDQCIAVVYRGGGPGKHTFDFTPAFYADWCERSEIFSSLQVKCASLHRAATRLSDRINCMAKPDHSTCTSIIETAKELKDVDRPKYEECRQLGQTEYNVGKPLSEQRIIGCAYERDKNGGPNSNGLTWHKLLPGACRDGTYVGRDGLDCCSGIPIADGPLGRECRVYYPKQ